MFLHTLVQTRGASFSFREVHGHLSFHRQSERPGYGPRQRTRTIGRDVRGSGACLRHHTIG